jgi:hypothetical protein
MQALEMQALEMQALEMQALEMQAIASDQKIRGWHINANHRY